MGAETGLAEEAAADGGAVGVQRARPVAGATHVQVGGLLAVGRAVRLAVGAGAATGEGEDDLVPHPGDRVRPGPDDRARTFVAEHHRQFAKPRRDAHIGVADAHRVDADQHLVAVRFPYLHVGELGIGSGVVHHRGAGVEHPVMLSHGLDTCHTW